MSAEDMSAQANKKMNFLSLEFLVLALGIAAGWGYMQQQVHQHTSDLVGIRQEMQLLENRQEVYSDRLTDFSNRITEISVRQELIRRDVEKILSYLEEDNR